MPEQNPQGHELNNRERALAVLAAAVVVAGGAVSFNVIAGAESPSVNSTCDPVIDPGCTDPSSTLPTKESTTTTTEATTTSTTEAPSTTTSTTEAPSTTTSTTSTTVANTVPPRQDIPTPTAPPAVAIVGHTE